jgi:hypothetical protein
MFRLKQALSQSEFLAGFSARTEPALRPIPIAVEPTDVPRRLSRRRRPSRVYVQIHGV